MVTKNVKINRKDLTEGKENGNEDKLILTRAVSENSRPMVNRGEYLYEGKVTTTKIAVEKEENYRNIEILSSAPKNLREINRKDWIDGKENGHKNESILAGAVSENPRSVAHRVEYLYEGKVRTTKKAGVKEENDRNIGILSSTSKVLREINRKDGTEEKENGNKNDLNLAGAVSENPQSMACKGEYQFKGIVRTTNKFAEKEEKYRNIVILSRASKILREINKKDGTEGKETDEGNKSILTGAVFENSQTVACKIKYLSKEKVRTTKKKPEKEQNNRNTGILLSASKNLYEINKKDGTEGKENSERNKLILTGAVSRDPRLMARRGEHLYEVEVTTTKKSAEKEENDRNIGISSAPKNLREINRNNGTEGKENNEENKLIIVGAASWNPQIVVTLRYNMKERLERRTTMKQNISLVLKSKAISQKKNIKIPKKAKYSFKPHQLSTIKEGNEGLVIYPQPIYGGSGVKFHTAVISQLELKDGIVPLQTKEINHEEPKKIRNLYQQSKKDRRSLKDRSNDENITATEFQETLHTIPHPQPHDRPSDCSLDPERSTTKKRRKDRRSSENYFSETRHAVDPPQPQDRPPDSRYQESPPDQPRKQTIQIQEGEQHKEREYGHRECILMRLRFCIRPAFYCREWYRLTQMTRSVFLLRHVQRPPFLESPPHR